MLSIGKVRNSRYYVDLAAANYYLKGGEPLGEWWGGGAADLGLKGQVQRRHFLGVLAGFSPTGRKLRRNAGSKYAKKNRPGFDLTFTPPKSVSVLWALGSGIVRHNVQECHRLAVLRVLRHIEENLAFMRKGKEGSRQVAGKLIAALFEHGTSRLNDPNLHTHVVLANVLLDGEESGALDASKLYENKMLLGALYRVELARLLGKTLTVDFCPIKGWYEIDGIPQGIIEYFSKRRAEVLAELRRTGNKGARAAAAAAKSTRRPKHHQPREELLSDWKRQAFEQGISIDEIAARFVVKNDSEAESLVNELVSDAAKADFDRVLENAIKKLAQERSHFSSQSVLRAVVVDAVRLGFSADQLLHQVETYLANCKDVLPLGNYKGQQQFTTPNGIDLEVELLAGVDRLRFAPGLSVTAQTKQEVVANSLDLSDEQWRAYNYLLDDVGRIKLLSGFPGTGKTRILEATRQAWEHSGYHVVGAAVFGKTARNLESKSGIKSYTVERLRFDLEDRTDDSPNRVRLDDKTILVIDEAAMLNTRQAAMLVREAGKAGATLVLGGDNDQLPPIEAGAPFPAIEERLEYAKLELIRRQRKSADVEAIHLLREGKARAALDNFKSRGLLHVAETHDDAIRQLVDDWAAGGGVEAPQDHINLVNTNAARSKLNALCREKRELAGLVSAEGIVGNSEKIAAGDQVMFLKNNRPLDVRNGDLGTVLRIEDQKILAIRLHNGGKEIQFSIDEYDHLTLGYAATVDKFQGGDCKHVRWLMEGTRLSKPLAYTAVTRHIESLNIYTDRIDAGEKLELLEAKLTRSPREPLAIELLQNMVAEQRRLEEELNQLPPRPFLLEDDPTPSVETALQYMEELRRRNLPSSIETPEVPVDIEETHRVEVSVENNMSPEVDDLEEDREPNEEWPIPPHKPNEESHRHAL